ncbi:kelch-like protein diablo [Heracleum sosnowskyi]|uniref:Kelch-like protein diablo n=1 Tax=Heracleum sosnowskyi TaxID=360622 RepID=A0AAD8HF61_9APIA|nr:kelch-like protein diablo [Heracleum sosnowskyi]
MEFSSIRKLQPFATANFSAPARNLTKSDLGAVVFGCKSNTIKECYFKELFGLPASHFAYVKKITPGLVLFLFNYSDRTLHGIFEATSPGQMNINPHGWTDDGTEFSPYPAQVKVRIKKRCCTLTEDQFKPIISSNYYERSHFYFELDRSQTSNLLSLFTSLPYDADACTSKNTSKWNTFFNPSPAFNIRHQRESCLSSDKGVFSDACTAIPPKTWISLFKSPSECNGVKIEKDDADTHLTQKTRSSLFKNSSDCDGLEKDEIFWTEALNSCRSVDKSNMEFESSCRPCSKRVSGESEGNVFDSSQCSEKFDNWETNWDRQGVGSDASQCFDELGNWESDRDDCSALTEVINFADNTLAGEARHEDRCFKLISSDLNTQHSEEANMVAGFRLLNLDGYEIQPSDSDCSAVMNEMNSTENREKDASHSSFSPGVQIEIACSSKVDINAATSSSGIQSLVVKLMQEIDGLKGYQLKQILKLNHLEQELVDSKAQIAKLKNRCSMLECGEPFSAVHVREEYEWLDKSTSDMYDETILIVGGFDGSSWLADLNSYSPLRDMMTSLCPMTTRRSYSSTAKLGDELFIFGGMDGGDIWYDTVESYNPRTDHWVSRPSLNKKKGSLAGVYLSNKIFAIGGGNGADCFEEVEMYDPNIGRWILTRSLQSKRFAPAASAMNNALYVTGGYDGREYLSTVERFDPREHSWVGVGNMSTKRSCHSVVVLNEKLYAVGGCDGCRMHSTVEIFDPRMNSWMSGESMSNSRAYTGAVVVGGKIYVIGGIKEKGGISDTIECYTEGYGWEVTNLKAVGKRCFFSAVAV